MIAKIAQYKIKKEKRSECLEAIRAFVAAVRANEPGTRKYEAYQLPDEVSFIHFMQFENEEAEQHHAATEYVKTFTGVLYPNCAIEPEFTDLNIVE